MGTHLFFSQGILTDKRFSNRFVYEADEKHYEHNSRR